MQRVKRLWVALACLIFASMLFAQTQTCPVQQYPPIPTGIDPAKVAVNPSDPNGHRLLLSVRKIALGQTAVHRGSICDPDGDAMVMSATAGQIAAAQDNTYTWTYKPNSIGIHYVNISVRDVRDTGDELTTTGTVAVQVIPTNRPPVCGALP